MLSDKHPGIAVHFQSNFQGLLHPVESIWSISQACGQGNSVMEKKQSVVVCPSLSGGASSA